MKSLLRRINQGTLGLLIACSVTTCGSVLIVMALFLAVYILDHPLAANRLFSPGNGLLSIAIIILGAILGCVWSYRNQGVKAVASRGVGAALGAGVVQYFRPMTATSPTHVFRELLEDPLRDLWFLFAIAVGAVIGRSEEHTSELQSQ